MHSVDSIILPQQLPVTLETNTLLLLLHINNINEYFPPGTQAWQLPCLAMPN